MKWVRRLARLGVGTALALSFTALGQQATEPDVNTNPFRSGLGLYATPLDELAEPSRTQPPAPDFRVEVPVDPVPDLPTMPLPSSTVSLPVPYEPTLFTPQGNVALRLRQDDAFAELEVLAVALGVRPSVVLTIDGLTVPATVGETLPGSIVVTTVDLSGVTIAQGRNTRDLETP
jgi:hypothetical protein